MSVYNYSDSLMFYVDSTVDNNTLELFQALNPTRLSLDRKMDPRVLVCAQRGWGHILQQNSAVLCLCVPALNHPGSLCAQGVGATFCSKTAPFFVCVCLL